MACWGLCWAGHLIVICTHITGKIKITQGNKNKLAISQQKISALKSSPLCSGTGAATVSRAVCCDSSWEVCNSEAASCESCHTVKYGFKFHRIEIYCKSLVCSRLALCFFRCLEELRYGVINILCPFTDRSFFSLMSLVADVPYLFPFRELLFPSSFPWFLLIRDPVLVT